MGSRTRRIRTRAAMCALAATAAAVAGGTTGAAPAAAAGGCPVETVADSLDRVWRFHMADGAILGFHDGGRWDPYETWGLLDVGSPYGTDSTLPEGCGSEVAEGQFVIPELQLGSLRVRRKVFVPTAGQPFARFLDFIHNPNPDQRAVRMVLKSIFRTNQGNPLLDATTDGDATVEANEPWFTSFFDDQVGGGDVHDDLHIFDGSANGKADVLEGAYSNEPTTVFWASNQKNLFVKYDPVVIPAGATVAYMHLELPRVEDFTLNAATTLAQQLAAGPPEVFQGMTREELAQVRNWNTTDVDADGAPTATDNCHLQSNSDQADMDGDGAGNACDGDVDGDGVSNADEAIRGTTGDAADSDGDGKNDSADQCPLKFGLGDDGCPRFDSPPDTKDPGVTIEAPKKVTLKRFLRGVTASATSDESAALDFEILAAPRSTRLRKAYSLILASKALDFGEGRRSVKLKPTRKLVGRSKRFKVRLRVTATDHGGNRAAKAMTIKVG